MSRGALEDDYHVCPCSATNRPVAVVQEQTDPKTHNRFFVVGNRDLWLTRFHELLREKGGDCCSSSDDESEFSDDLMPALGSLNQLVRETDPALVATMELIQRTSILMMNHKLMKIHPLSVTDKEQGSLCDSATAVFHGNPCQLEFI